ncbi:MAG: nucleoside deaminase [Janthinobacterium lividum]
MSHSDTAPSDHASPGAEPSDAASQADRRFIGRALELARKGGDTPGASPIGCVIVLDGNIVAEGHNEVGMRHDPTAHAEMVAIRRAGARLDRDDLRGATLYSTLQPCGMCTMASIWSRIGRIVYGAGREDVHSMYFEDRHLDTMNFIHDAYREDMEVVAGVMAAECAALYYGPNDDPPLEQQGNL